MDTNDASIQGQERNPMCSLEQIFPAPYISGHACSFLGKKWCNSFLSSSSFDWHPNVLFFLALFEISRSLCTRLYDGPYYEAGLKL
jgi:hypothetical protein